jgi:hypothetical protein
MTVVAQGPFGGGENTAHGNSTWRGVKRIMTTPSYASAHYTKNYDPELAAKALEPFRNGTIGYVGTYQMSFALLDFVKRAVPKARYVDASELVDRIKVIKSPEEMELVKRAALMQDGAMQAALESIKPGMRDYEVSAAAQHYSRRHGSEQGIYLCASGPVETPIKFSQIHLQNRVIQAGDYVALLVEDNGPGGMYTELGRSCVVGVKVPQAMKDELDFCKSARKMTLDLLKPARIAGCGGLKTRHDAMLAGERGADYVMFGEIGPDGRRPSFEAIVERVEWWANLFEIPCVGFAAATSEIAPLAAAGVEFVAVGDAVWQDPRGPAAALAEAAGLLAGPETVA